MVLIDTRTNQEYQQFTLPGAVHIPAEDLLSRGWRSFFRNDKRAKVFFGNGNSSAIKAYMTAKRAGFDNVFVMDGGLGQMFHELFVDIRDDEISSLNLQKRSTARFLKDARIFFLEGGVAEQPEEERHVIRAPEESEVIPVIGGC